MDILTRGGLVAACIQDLTGAKKVYCTFNPHQYTLSKSNSFSQKPKPGANNPHGDYVQANPQSLSLSLTLDAYETGGDVREDTDLLTELMRPIPPDIKTKGQQPRPSVVIFCWGGFEFKGVITNMTQRFTLFDIAGKPLRAQVDLSFTQYIDEKEFPKQSKNRPGTFFDRERLVFAGDRLDAIAEEVLGDPDQWQRIAEYNHIRNPLALRPGQKLKIPLD